MNDGIEVVGAAGLAATLIGAPKRMQEGQRVAVAIAMREVRAQAISDHDFSNRTGALQRSVSAEAGIVGGVVTGRVWLNSNIAPYAKWVHDGWKRTADIIPKAPRRALHFVIGGANIFCSRVKKAASYGGDPFLFDAWEAKLDETQKLLANASVRAIVEKE